MKTFADLQFTQHTYQRDGNEKMASMQFDNGYGVSVFFGKSFYSNGVDTYELAVLYNNEITYNTDITDEVIGPITESEISEIMVKIQQLPK